MAFTVPNIESGPTFDGQAVPDQADLATLAAIGDQSGVVSGCGVTAHGGGSMAVDVASGTVRIGGVSVAVSAAANTAIGAASATDRRDMVVVNNAGAVSVVAGTACGTAGWTRNSAGLPPVKAAIPASSIMLAEVYVAASTASIAAGNIIDKTVTFVVSTPAISSASGVLASDTSCTTSWATFLTTASLATGTWLVTLNAFAQSGTAAGETVDVQVVAGTATVSFTGPAAGSPVVYGTVQAWGNCTLTFLATVTVAGTLVFQTRAGATAGNPRLLAESWQFNVQGGTGYTAIKIA